MCSLKKEDCRMGSTSLQTAGRGNRRSSWKSAAESNGSEGGDSKESDIHHEGSGITYLNTLARGCEIPILGSTQNPTV